MKKVKLSVSVQDDHIPRFADVVDRLKKAGFEVENALETTGVVTGAIDDAKAQELKKIAGVGHVEEQREYQIAPPESSIQ